MFRQLKWKGNNAIEVQHEEQSENPWKSIKKYNTKKLWAYLRVLVQICVAAPNSRKYTGVDWWTRYEKLVQFHHASDKREQLYVKLLYFNVIYCVRCRSRDNPTWNEIHVDLYDRHKPMASAGRWSL